ncbi:MULTISPECIES: VOC family protein [unclassified Haladaptatus]|uniref:VOC family protein n=1 Tax=unclassified Haladaptatus TaxID=2622732 RepID=UPI0023E8989E|nr:MULTISPECIES: VOC family protein [unclassified Haladaptatus]
MGRIVHFEIHAQNPERALEFYENVFDWTAEQWGDMDYWLLVTGEADEPGIDGAITKREGPRPTGHDPFNGFACTVDVDSVDETVDLVERFGGKVITEKHAVDGVGWLAYCEDTEGNQFGLMEADETAA